MRISRVKVHNYRNIGGIEILLNPECNYIIGENNLGKSNFSRLYVLARALMSATFLILRKVLKSKLMSSFSQMNRASLAIIFALKMHL